MKTLLILGNDKLGGMAFELFCTDENLKVLIDRSTNYKRIFRLVRKRSLSFRLIFKMVLSEYNRNGSKPPKSIPGISRNSEVLSIIREFNPNRILLFRAGLIINKIVLKTGVPILNIHAAKVPEYGGIGSIERALKDEAFKQFASFHVITERIDQGRLIDSEKFELLANLSYAENEKIAYDASLRLLLRNIHRNCIT